MAATHGRINVKVRDGRGNKASTSVHVTTDDGVTLAEITAAIDVFTGLMNGVTDGIIYAAEYHHLATLTLTPNAGTGSKVNDALVLSFPVSGNTTRSDFFVPAVADAVVVGNLPDMTDGNAIDLLADFMEAAFQIHATNDSHFTNAQTQNLAATARGLLRDRKFGARSGAAIGT